MFWYMKAPCKSVGINRYCVIELPFRTLHSADSTKYRVAEIFMCFLGFNKLSLIIRLYLVPNLEIIFPNAFYDIGLISRKLIHARPKSNNFQRAAAL